MFLDTADFRLYNNSFILRRRTAYQDGFPIEDPEIVFKFRNADMDPAASMDVRPKIAGPYRVKFKSEALPLKDQLGGFPPALLPQLHLSAELSVHEPDRTSLQTIARVIPAVAGLIGSQEGKVELVNSDPRRRSTDGSRHLGFGKGFATKCNISLGVRSATTT